MALFAGSSLVAKDGPTEGGSYKQEFSLGWWDIETPPIVANETDTQAVNGTRAHRVRRKLLLGQTVLPEKRFAIDTGTPSMLGYKKRRTLSEGWKWKQHSKDKSKAASKRLNR